MQKITDSKTGVYFTPPEDWRLVAEGIDWFMMKDQEGKFALRITIIPENFKGSDKRHLLKDWLQDDFIEFDNILLHDKYAVTAGHGDDDMYFRHFLTIIDKYPVIIYCQHPGKENAEEEAFQNLLKSIGSVNIN